MSIPENSAPIPSKCGEAHTKLHESVARRPDDAVVATQYADALRKERQFDKAAAEYRRALALDGCLVDAWYGLGHIQLDSGALAEAARCFRSTLALAPERKDAHFNLGKALFELGEIDDALGHFRVAAESPHPELHRAALAALACLVPGSPRSDNAAVLQTRRAWAQVIAATEAPATPSGPRPGAQDGRMRLGYCSKFFHAQNWMKPVWGVIRHHDRAAFEVHLFSDGQPPSADSGYAANSLDRFHDVRGISNADLAAIIAREGIDVLIDLNGYSYQRRLGVFIRRPAPVNIAWFNMYATTGIDAFDYIVGDAVVIPSSEEQFYSERVLRVPGSYLAFSVSYPVPDVAPPPCLSTGHITFGSFCSQYKITDQVIAVWAEILRRAPQANLLLKNGALGDRSNRTALLERFARCAVPPERLILEGPAPHGEFLEAYARVDIALDTFPYNGGTTTTEALWQGVPVLTFHGDRWASRQSRSVLLAAGLDDWCLRDLDAYIDRAVLLARSATTAADLALLRAAMRERLARMPVCDSATLCRALEQIYSNVARREDDRNR